MTGPSSSASSWATLPALALVALAASMSGPAAANAANVREDVAHSAVARAEDHCGGQFVAAAGSKAYQFSPALAGELGKVALFARFEMGHGHADGKTLWKLTVENEDGAPIRHVQGQSRGVASKAQAVVHWDGRDDEGRPVPAGRYRYVFAARHLIRGAATGVSRYDDLAPLRHPFHEALQAAREVVVNYDLSVGASHVLRSSLVPSSCERHQNAPLEAGFGYNFYYGSTHSHSNYSDGGHATAECNSAPGTGSYDPAAVYDFVRNTAGLDYWVVNEHNHLMDDALSGTFTGEAVRARYQAGLAAARNASVDGAFVAIYGMEWGVTTNNDQGHVTLLETPKLFGWEPCVNCNGAAAECTGAACTFDVFTPKRGGYLSLYARSVENPSPVGALGILCHPGAGNFDNFALDQNAVEAVQGIAIRSGSAFTTTGDCGNANVSTVDYTLRYKEALAKGFKVGPTADHDSHCANYGIGIPTRTVYLLPNGATPTLTKAALLKAHKSRHFFASEDSNAQLVFATSNGRHIMGDAFTASSATSMRTAVYDPNNEAVSLLEIWRGKVGAAVPSAPYLKVNNQSALSFTDNQTSGTWYYWVHAVQADGHDVWSAPMWVTYGISCDPLECDDGNPCNGVETCQNGACTPGAPPSCDDANPCTADSCDATRGCVHTPVSDGTSCSDGNTCNGAEVCVAGQCAAGAPLQCDDGNPCTAKSCDPILGCVITPVNNGTSCSDGNPCNGLETCQLGACAAGTPVSCDDGNVCTADSCEPLTGQCVHLPVADGTHCGDENVCNGIEACQAGTCMTSPALDCDDHNPCTADSCDPTGGCVHTPVVDGTSCSDGNACNGAEVCGAGQCRPGTPLQCSDGNACNGVETCNPNVGCVAGTPAQCTGTNECLAYSCDAASGCQSAPLAAGTQCLSGSGKCDGAGLCVPRVNAFAENFQSTLASWTETGIGSKCWSIKSASKASVPGSGADNLVGRATACTWGRTLTSRGVDTTALEDVTLRFSRFVDSELAAGDLFKVDVYDGTKWVTLTSWTDGQGDDSTWRQQSYDVTRYRNAAFKVRFYARTASATTAIELDDLVIQGTARP